MYFKCEEDVNLGSQGRMLWFDCASPHCSCAVNLIPSGTELGGDNGRCLVIRAFNLLNADYEYA